MMSVEGLRQRLGLDVLVVDLSSIIYPLWHMSGSQPDPDWTSKQALARVDALASTYRHIGVCVDSKRSWRREHDPAYKATRPVSEEPLRHQITLTVEGLRRLGYPVWEAERFEADDVVASAVKKLRSLGHHTVIATQDKDLLQLVTDAEPSVRVYNTRDNTEWDEASVVAKLAVLPAQVRDWLTLVGDSSDNVPGVRGIGPKGAAELLLSYGTLERALGAAAADPRPKGPLALLAKCDPAIIENARILVGLRDDLEVPVEQALADRVPVQEEIMDDFLGDALDEVAALEPATSAPVAAPPAAEKPPPKKNGHEFSGEAIVVTGGWERSLEPANLRDAAVLAKYVFASRLFSQYGNEQAVFSTILAGRELGLGVMASLRGFHIIEGKPTLAADLIRALVLQSGKCEYFTCTERTNERATWTTLRRGDPAPISLTFSWEDAQAAQVPLTGRSGGGTAWVKHRADMLSKTASTKLARLVYSDVTFGLYATEELGEL